MNIFTYDPDVVTFNPLSLEGIDDVLGFLDYLSGYSEVMPNIAGLRFRQLHEEGDATTRELGDSPSLGLSQVMTMSRRARSVLQDLVEEHVQFVPLATTSGDIFACRVRPVLDALDPLRSSFDRFSSGNVFAIERYVFKLPTTHLPPIFRMPYLRRSYIYVTDAFVDRVRTAELQGFCFEHVWSEPAASPENEPVNSP
jgi:hypothetical protein